MADGYMTLREAEEFLGISRVKMGQLVKTGVLRTVANPLDSRSKLVKSIDIEYLRANSKPARKIKKKSDPA